MTSYYDNNYGEYEINDEDNIKFYKERQRTNVRKKCKGCGQTVSIQPDYAYCNSCATKIERGQDLE